jgi:hypothetical protein
MTARDQFEADARADKVYELTCEHYQRLREKLQAGDADLVSAIDEAAFASLPDAFWREVVVSAAHGHALSIGDRIVKLVEKAVMKQAEAEAEREVERMERERKESQDEARIERALDNQGARAR